MLQLLYTESSRKQFTESNYKTAYVLANILKHPYPPLTQSLATPECLNLLFKYVESAIHRQPVFTEYYCEIFQTLLNTYPKVIITEFRRRETAHLMNRHFESFPMCALFLNIIDALKTKEGFDSVIPVCSTFLINFILFSQWLVQYKYLQLLLETVRDSPSSRVLPPHSLSFLSSFLFLFLCSCFFSSTAKILFLFSHAFLI